MRKESQLLKGCLEGCVLKIIDIKGEIYGYDILKTLKENGFNNITEGTLYPLYTRLQKNGLLSAAIKQSNIGPARKYYSLTQKGYDELKQFNEDWLGLNKNVNSIMQGKIT
ncbi:MAG: PadR family transcriptional regulator [Clostridia bacterium]|nr:PadR family transcriptional regulator [Clostridia bacterium]MDD4799111.1 PadR family transcriptional regulator [Clostridia bacterium]